ncbi:MULTISPECIES: sensor histidine kinase [unclassified Streptomyces]|uniref:sensor histidine kinase n=1 Tax=unclassified Streptomyces TaxID=2593676 RepID=UPI002258EEC4|nr:MULTISPECIES: histidine kinase [unclassified Streptomyces]MCX5333029.1 histidine kinase [Streptomyces sp. NBC_00140]MCX5362444.1 histidine kinase [Streptomyces sp. NBC_00124]
MSGSGGWWRQKSTPAKVETYTRWSFHFFALIEVVSIGLPLFGEMVPWVAASLALVVAGHAVVCAVTAARALDWTLGRREQPVHMLWTLGAITAAVAVMAIVIAEHGPSGDDVDTAAGSVFAVVLIFGAGIFSLGVRSRRRMYSVVTGFAVGAGLVAFAGRPGPAALISVLVVLLGGGFLAFTSAFSVWLLNAVYELDEARETRARLAVAEERLRFGRDLHDVMGRNLAVIALKSELAVQLARRGRPEAEEQMVEVQRIAQESQREVRDVVRGYREADLGVELTGAQGVLEAAGIRCEVSGEAAGLPVDVQSALGWVVREATTNVLRHGDAGRCAVDVRVTRECVVLKVENDGVAAPSGPGGSGLAGLRERLAAVDGTLEAGPVGDGVFRVVASVPLRMSEVMA